MQLEFSFPKIIILLIILAVVLPPVYWVTEKLARGTIEFSSALPGAHVVDPQQGVRYDLPTSLTRRSGRYPFTLSAPGYVSKDVAVTFPSLYLHRKYDFTLEKELYQEEDPEAYLKIPLGTVLPHTESGFRVNYPEPNGTYSVQLTGATGKKANDPQVIKTLKQNQQKALAWIESQGVDPKSLKLHWLPFDPSKK